jgi:hypothetical protein
LLLLSFFPFSFALVAFFAFMLVSFFPKRFSELPLCLPTKQTGRQTFGRQSLGAPFYFVGFGGHSPSESHPAGNNFGVISTPWSDFYPSPRDWKLETRENTLLPDDAAISRRTTFDFRLSQGLCVSAVQNG